ncbi:MAG: YceI family protein [Fimbriimonas ginsengisoli]|uniref:YceI family protein n=1 Tax=Fimbriimonas ginsengisoli TaxID=1005039 RepID=A0A931LVK4_FIMGI|nr:YceI family protein [Fimbriimonas ginsengisoli]
MTQTTLTRTKTYTLDPAHSTARFWVRHLMIAKVHGVISGISGTVSMDVDRPEAASVAVELDASTLATGQEQRDAHLKSPDFLDVERFPTIAFHSKQINQTGTGEYELIGDLTIRGATREVVLNAELTDEVASPWGGYKIGASATGVINREDFGVTWNQILETGGVAVGKEVHLQIEAELDRPAD